MDNYRIDTRVNNKELERSFEEFLYSFPVTLKRKLSKSIEGDR